MFIFGLCLIIIGYAISQQINSVQIKNNGTINTSSNLRINVTSIDWGSFQPPTPVVRTVKFTNLDASPITLNMTTKDLPTFLTLTWDKENYVLPVNGEIEATFTLTAVYNAPEGAFSFTIVVDGN